MVKSRLKYSTSLYTAVATAARGVFSERDVRYMSSAVRLSFVVCLLTFVHPTQAIEIFGNVSTPFGTLAIC